MKRSVLIALLIVIVILLGLFIIGGFIYLQFNQEPYVPEKAYLKIDLGGPVAETAPTRLLGMSQGTGATPRFILLAPDGQCCYRNTVTQERFCNCYRVSGGLRCVDRDCKGAHEECDVGPLTTPVGVQLVKNEKAQAGVKPPTFVLFTNAAKEIPAHYTRYLERAIREKFDFSGSPIRLNFKERPKR